MPALIVDAGERAAHATLEFFTAQIPNAHTRRAYVRAVFGFCNGCECERVSLAGLTAATISAYLSGPARWWRRPLTHTRRQTGGVYDGRRH